MIHRTGFVDIYKKWLIFLIVLFLFAPNTIPFINKIIFILFFVVIFSPMFFLNDKLLSLGELEYGFNKTLCYLLIILQFISADYASRYYTGSGILDSLLGLVSGGGNYYKYQEHFSENELATFSISKIPAIISAALVKGVFIYIMSVFVLLKRSSYKNIFLLFSIIPPILFSISRGTFFEVFEVALCILYFFKLKEIRVSKSINFKSLKSNFIILFIFIILMFLFVLNASNRYEDSSLFFSQSCATQNFCFEPYTSLIVLEYPIYLLSTYFSAGIFFLTQYMELVLEGSFLSSIMPIFSTSYIDENGYSLFRQICTHSIDCGVAWGPELFKWISVFGLIGLLFIFPVSMYIFFKVEKRILYNLNVFSLPLCYFILLYIVSIPVGSFYTVSSANILCSIVFFLLWKFSKKYHI